MRNQVYLIGVTNGAANALALAISSGGDEPFSVGGPADVPITTSDGVIAIVPFFGPDTFRRTLDALYRRGVMACAALLPRAEFGVSAEAFRAGADDVIAEDEASTDMQRMLSYLADGGHRRSEPMQVRSLEDVERDAIAAALHACRGQVSLTARRLGIGRSTLYRKIEQYALTNDR